MNINYLLLLTVIGNSCEMGGSERKQGSESVAWCFLMDYIERDIIEHESLGCWWFEKSTRQLGEHSGRNGSSSNNSMKEEGSP